jgi:hypothetical protein
MKPVELIGNVDDQHRLRANVPESIPPGEVRLIVLPTEEDDSGRAWMEGISREWADELADPRGHLYDR